MPTCKDTIPKERKDPVKLAANQVCENTVGSYSCSCREGSVLQVKHILSKKHFKNNVKEDELSCRRIKPEERLGGEEVETGARGEEGGLQEPGGQGELGGQGGGQGELGGVAAFRAKPAVRRLQRTVNR